jgi:hypothetical protein
VIPGRARVSTQDRHPDAQIEAVEAIGEEGPGFRAARHRGDDGLPPARSSCRITRSTP